LELEKLNSYAMQSSKFFLEQLSILTKFRNEKEIFQQLTNYLSKNSLISKFQFDFRPKHSTVNTITLHIQSDMKWLENMDGVQNNWCSFPRYWKRF
jgi:hypothetical protein